MGSALKSKNKITEDENKTICCGGDFLHAFAQKMPKVK
ncbi:hypothetical protein EFW58_03338 [Bacillus velezensis]|nr:hypothetical protein EFW58_03338 [Bacillus velezensis]